MKALFNNGWIVTTLFLTALLWAGCSSDDGPSDGGTPDTAPPVIASVTAIDATHVQVTFDEKVSRPSAQRTEHYTIVAAGATMSLTSLGKPDGAGSPSGTSAVPVPVDAAILQADGKNVLLTTGLPMSAIAYTLSASGVGDVNGNKMTEAATREFTGVDTPDATSPAVVARSPRPGATGVGTSEPVAVTFSEAMSEVAVIGAFSWMSSKDTVLSSVKRISDAAYVFSPLSPLDRSTTYAVTVSDDAHDRAGNPLVKTSWTFTTTSAQDATPPALVSTVPADGAVDVPTGVALTLTFSERIDPASLEDVLITPTPSAGTEEWSSDGWTVSFTPDELLVEDTQYYLVFPKGAIRDLSGNRSTGTVTVAFTTGSSFASGGIDGTLSGDIYSAGAGDPTGALVAASTTGLFADDETDILGVAFVGENDTYSVLHLPDATYYPFAIMDSNGDGVIDPGTGDAFGAYGVDVRAMDFTASPVLVEAGATVGSVDFLLYDPEAISGTVLSYGEIPVPFRTGELYFVGAFSADGFDPDNPGNPSAWVAGGPLAWDAHYSINALDDGLAPGTYYVGAYIDANDNGVFDPNVDPSGFHSNMQSGIPYPITVENGGDATNVDIYLEMPSADAMAPPSKPWEHVEPQGKNRVSLERLGDKLREALRSRDAR